MYGDCVEVINAALALLGQSPVSVTRLATGITPTAPNGGTAGNVNDGNLATVVTTTTPVGVLNPYIVASLDLGSLRRIAYVDVYRLSLSVGASRGEFMLQHSIDGEIWEQSAEAFKVTTDTTNRRRVNLCSEVRYLRIARVGTTDLGAAVATLASIDVYPFGANQKDQTVAKLYPGIRAAVLTDHYWRCTMRKVQLVAAESADGPLTEWPYAFEMPSFLLAGPSALFTHPDDNAPYKDWELYHGRLYTDILTVYIDHQVRAEEESWPPYLRQLMVYAAGAEFAEPITDQTSKAENLRALAYGPPGADGKGGYFRTARNRESQNKTSEGIRDFSLVEVRG
jgi:hypothetical protein